MRLLNIHLKNFRSHKDTHIDFTTMASPVLIKGVNHDTNGSNGAGKTSIFYAIEYVLYPEKKKYITDYEKEGSVSLEFTSEGSTYRVFKEYTDTDYKITLYKNGEKFLTAKTEIEKYLRNILKISKSLFEQTVYQSQGFNNFFSFLTPKMKSYFIAELLNMSKWEEYYKTANKQANSILTFGDNVNMKISMKAQEIQNTEEKLKELDYSKLMVDIETNRALKKSKEGLLKLTGNSAELLASDKYLSDNLAASNEKVKSLYENGSKYTKEVAEYVLLVSDLKSRKVIATDDNHRQSLLANSLSVEKQIAAREQEIMVAQDIESAKNVLQLVKVNRQCPYCIRGFESEAEYSAYIFNAERKIADDVTKREEIEKTLISLDKLRKEYADVVDSLNKQANVYAEYIANLGEAEQKLSVSKEYLEFYSKEYLVEVEANKKVQELYANNRRLMDQTDTTAAAKLEVEITSLEDTIQGLSDKIGRYKLLMDNKNALDKDRVKLSNSLTSIGKAGTMMKYVAGALSSNGIQKWLFMNALEEIAALANSLLDPVKYTLSFVMEKLKATDDEYKPAFDILVHHKGHSRYVDELSGGEKAIVNFAMRLAFSTIMASAYGFEFMIIDEGFQDTDDRNISIIAGMLTQLSSQFQIFVVTHIKEFESYFSNIIHVIKRDDESTVEVQY